MVSLARNEGYQNMRVNYPKVDGAGRPNSDPLIKGIKDSFRS